MSSYSYLGLDTHPGWSEPPPTPCCRGRAQHLDSPEPDPVLALQDAEDALSELFDVEAVTLASCAAAAWASLPLIASGLFTDGQPPLMVFDKNAHFCLNAMKPAVADEAPVTTIAHNDLEALEELCRTHPLVAYVADGVYSTGGAAPVPNSCGCRSKYGLFLFFDEAHGTRRSARTAAAWSWRRWAGSTTGR